MRNWNRMLSIIAITLTTVWLFGMPGTAYCQDEIKQIEAEAKKIKNSDQPFNIKLATGDKKTSYKVGDEISIVFSADEDCYLYLIDIGTSGKAHLLFPNKFQSANKAEKGKVYMIPGKDSKMVFKVKAPTGTNYLKAIATKKPIKAVDGAKKDTEGPFAELAEPTDTFKDIGVELKKEKNWAEAELKLEVTDK